MQNGNTPRGAASGGRGVEAPRTNRLVQNAADLCDAAAIGNLDKIRQIVTSGINVNAGDYDRRTALHLAASEGYLDVVVRLIEEFQAFTSPVDRWGGTPLDEAVRNRHEGICAYLLKKGASKGKMSTREIENAAADLCHAAATGDLGRLSSLVKHRGLDVNIGDYDKRCALHLAASEGFHGVVTFLVEELGANINVKDRWGGSPLQDAQRSDFQDIAKYLLSKGAEVDRTSPVAEDIYNVNSSLCEAASVGNLDRLSFLVLDRGLDVNGGDYDRRTALHLAASEGMLDVVMFLVDELGADFQVTDRWGGTPFDDSIRHGHDSVSQYFKMRGATSSEAPAALLVTAVNMVDASSQGNVDRMRDLVERGVDANESDYDRRTPLHLAAANGHLDVAVYLVEVVGVEVNPTDRFGGTPLDDAIIENKPVLVDYLKGKGGKQERALAMAMKAEDGKASLAAAADPLAVIGMLAKDLNSGLSQCMRGDGQVTKWIAGAKEDGTHSKIAPLLKGCVELLEAASTLLSTAGPAGMQQYLESIRDAAIAMHDDILEGMASFEFNLDAMKATLPADVFARFCKSLVTGEATSEADQKAMATGMFGWARKLGCVDFAHWFFPTRHGGGACGGAAGALKMDTLIDLDFSSSQANKPIVPTLPYDRLFKGETDGSSFPNGGLRVTHAAAAFTSWDRSSCPFVHDKVLRIPCSLVTHYGQCIDEKTPLLRSVDALRTEGLQLLKTLGIAPDAKDILSYLGWEQEFFVIPSELYLKRPDLVNCGRTLLGKLPTRNQQASLNYFGPVPERVDAFLREVQDEMLRTGCAMAVRHNEVAPGQHEMSPIFCTASASADRNVFFMEICNKFAARHGLQVLFHEKPFAGINGNGKHSNWSVGTDTGLNFFYPGKTDESKKLFIIGVACLAHGLHKYNELIRCAVSHSGNDHRLGAQEAPPAVMSLYPGVGFEHLVDAIIAGGELIGAEVRAKTKQTGCASAMQFKAGACDRNRTAPFPFCGNRFEFRAVGSSQNCAFPVMICNAIMAAGMKHLNGIITSGVKERDAVAQVLKEHRNVIFTGNGYSAEWIAEAGRRGLPNLVNTTQALAEWASPKNKAMFQALNILSPEEVIARGNIMYETYCTTVSIEARTFLHMLESHIIPACTKHLCQGGLGVGKSTQEAYETIATAAAKLEELLEEFEKCPDDVAGATFLCDRVLPAMASTRALVDTAEVTLPKELYPYPDYEALLYSHHH